MGKRREHLELLRERAERLIHQDPEMTSTILAARLGIQKPTAERWVSEIRRGRQLDERADRR